MGFTGGAPITGDIQKFSVKYNTTDFSYLSSAAYSDSASFRSGSNVVKVVTAAIDGAAFSNAIVAPGFVYSDSSQLVFCVETITNDLIFFDPVTLVESSRITASNYQQAIGIDPVNLRLYNTDLSGTIHVTDFSGNIVQTITCPAYAPSAIAGFYDYKNDLFYISKETNGVATLKIDVWSRSGSNFVLQESKWYFSTDGNSIDNVFDKVTNFYGSGASSACRLQEQSVDGRSGIAVWLCPISTGWNTEGLAMLPDGTFMSADPSSLHGSIVGGNRLWVTDPRGIYKKYVRYPSMTRFSKFTGGTVSGHFDTELLTVSTGTTVWGTVLDSQGWSNLANADAYEFEMSDTIDGDKVFRGSNTAPTVSSFTSIYSDLVEYANWGVTVPGASQSTPPAFRYIQFGVTIRAAIPSSEITIDALIAGLNGKCKALLAGYESQYMYVISDDGNKIPIIPNQANTANSFRNSTSSQQPAFVSGSPGYISKNSGGPGNWLMDLISQVSSDQTGHITAVTKRSSALTRSMLFAMCRSTDNLHQLRFRHNTSADTPASHIGIEYIDATGAVVNRVGFTDTSLSWMRLDFVSTGSAWKIKKNGVDQALTVTGANDGTWLGDLSSPNRGAIGAVYGLSVVAGPPDLRLWIYCNAELNSTEMALIDSFITQENLLA